jgi:drug/metabolite transporter (DMT)-like permease
MTWQELWADFSWWTAVLLLLMYVVVDVMYAMYMIAVTKLQPAKAASIGAVMYVLLAAGIINFSHNPLYLIPIGIGSWLGTFIAVWREKHKK